MWRLTAGIILGSGVTLGLHWSRAGEVEASQPTRQPDRVVLLRCDDLAAECEGLRRSLLLSQAKTATLSLELDCLRRQGTQFKTVTGDDEGDRIPAPQTPFPTN